MKANSWKFRRENKWGFSAKRRLKRNKIKSTKLHLIQAICLKIS